MKKAIDIGDLGKFCIEKGNYYLKIKFWNYDKRCKNTYVDIHDVGGFVQTIHDIYNMSTSMRPNEEDRQYNYEDNIIINANKKDGVSLYIYRGELRTHPVNDGPKLGSYKDMGQVLLDWNKICRKFDFVHIA